MANFKELKDAERLLTRRYQKVQTAFSHETMSTAVFELTQCIETIPVLKQLAEALSALEDDSLIDDWLNSKGWLRPPVERNKKARICYYYLAKWYSQMGDERFDFDRAITDVGHRIAVSGGFDIYARTFVENLVDPFVEYLDEELEALIGDVEVAYEDVAEPNPANKRQVFIVHGRDTATLNSVLDYLGNIGLEPRTFDDARALLEEGSPTILQVVSKGIAASWAVVVLITPDDIARLQEEPEEVARKQARPNVIFEAGFAFGRYPKRTVLVEYEEPSMFSDLHGHYVVRLRQGEDGIEGLEDLRKQLKATGCEVSD